MLNQDDVIQGPAVEGLNESTKRHKSFGRARICMVGTKNGTRDKLIKCSDQRTEDILPALLLIVNHDATAASYDAKSNRH